MGATQNCCSNRNEELDVITVGMMPEGINKNELNYLIKEESDQRRKNQAAIGWPNKYRSHNNSPQNSIRNNESTTEQSNSNRKAATAYLNQDLKMINKKEDISPYKSSPGIKPYQPVKNTTRPPFRYDNTKLDSPGPDVKISNRSNRPKSSLSNSMGKDGTVTLHHDQDTLMETLFNHVSK